MYVLNKDPTLRCSEWASRIYIDYGVNPPKKEELPILVYTSTMGYLMGYRELEYLDQMSYTSESIFENAYSNYLYFVLEDYTGSQTMTDTYGMLGDSGVINGNILGIIPINSNSFTPTFDNNSNFIYKKREYFGPVDISRITVRLLNQRGKLANLRGTNWNFTLHVKTIYNLIEKSKLNMRSAGFL
jgi:hypothetical protein